MSYSAVDTLQITKRLQNTGMNPESAEEFAEILKERDEASFEKLVTKEDLHREISSVRNEISDVRKDITIAKRDVLIAVGLMNFAVAIAIINFMSKLVK